MIFNLSQKEKSRIKYFKDPEEFEKFLELQKY